MLLGRKRYGQLDHIAFCGLRLLFEVFWYTINSVSPYRVAFRQYGGNMNQQEDHLWIKESI
jgi:hypothetical protein